MRSHGLVASMLLALVMLGCARDEAAAPLVLDSRSVDLSSPSPVGPGTLPQHRGHSNAVTGTADEAVAEAEELDGRACVANCSGHDAGYEWAEQNAIADPNDCGGDSDSFVEGCMAYAQARIGDRDSYAE